VSRLDIIAGPNGAGKTTLFELVIEPARPGLPFVNADRIASQRWPGEELAHSYEAASIAAATRSQLIDARLDFCTETVFSHESKLSLVVDAEAAGSDIVMHVVVIPLKLSGPRVTARVDGEGHTVPAEKIADRYSRLWTLVATALKHCRLVVFYDNSHDDGPIEVASRRRGTFDYPPRSPGWAPEALTSL